VGISVSWLAVRGADKDAVYKTLGLAETGERDELPAESPIAGAALAEGWFVVVLDRYGHELVSDEDVLRRLSQAGEVVAGAAEEHVMCCFSCAWHRGQRLWWTMHDAQHGIDHLEVQGAMPPEFDEIRARLTDEQRASGNDRSVDYVYDIPIETAKVVCGFSYDETEPVDGFAVLNRVG
jgi:hypothetical protein